MKHAPTVVAALLGALFVFAGAAVLFHLVDAPPPPEGTLAGHFMAALAPTGYLTFVKSLELIGGLLILGPIIVNILAFHGFVMKGEGLFSPNLFFIVAAAIYLLWVERRAFGALLRRA